MTGNIYSIQFNLIFIIRHVEIMPSEEKKETGFLFTWCISKSREKTYLSIESSATSSHRARLTTGKVARLQTENLKNKVGIQISLICLH
jgi:hypothetical protein